MLGLQPKPTEIELAVYLLYAIPMLAYVLWPRQTRIHGRVRVWAIDPQRSALTYRVLKTRHLESSTYEVVAFFHAIARDRLSCTAFSACGSSTDPSGETVKVGISDAGCSPASLKLTSGPKNFVITATGSGKVTEYEILDGTRILGEREHHAGRNAQVLAESPGR